MEKYCDQFDFFVFDRPKPGNWCWGEHFGEDCKDGGNMILMKRKDLDTIWRPMWDKKGIKYKTDEQLKQEGIIK